MSLGKSYTTMLCLKGSRTSAVSGKYFIYSQHHMLIRTAVASVDLHSKKINVTKLKLGCESVKNFKN